MIPPFGSNQGLLVNFPSSPCGGEVQQEDRVIEFPANVHSMDVYGTVNESFNPYRQLIVDIYMQESDTGCPARKVAFGAQMQPIKSLP